MKKKPTPAPAIAATTTQRDPRAYARTQAILGIGMLAHAMNATGSPATHYRYSDAAQARFRALGMLMVELIEEGEIIEQGEHDAAFQRFMANAVIPPISPGTQK
jgi:hypothetical protein